MDLLFKNFTYFLETYFIISPIVFIGVYVAIVAILFIINIKAKLNPIWVLIIALYGALLIDVTLLCEARIGNSGIMLNPFENFIEIIFNHNIHVIRGVTSNIILFIPFGFICFYFYKIKKIYQIFISSLILSFLIELMQFILSVGCFETSDIICNVIGGVLGSIVAIYLVKLIKYLKVKIGGN